MPPDEKNDEPEIRVVEETGASSKEDTPAAGQHFQRDDRTPREERVDRKPPRERERSSDNRFAEDEDEPFGPRVQKRLNQFRRRTGDAEARATALAEENRRLLAQVQEAGATAMSHYEAAANARLDAAKREHLDAYESGDGLKVVEASRKLASAQNALDQVDALKARQKQEATRQPAQQQPQRATYSANTQDWIDDHPWFESDQAAREDAIRIHDRMVKQGYTPDTPAYFKELTARCRTMFPEHFSGDDDDASGVDDDTPLPRSRAERRAEEEGRRAPPVAGVSRSTMNGRKVTEVKLTPAMIEAAQIAGVHPKKYAEQMIALRKEGKL